MTQTLTQQRPGKNRIGAREAVNPNSELVKQRNRKIFTQNIDSKLDSTKPLINKPGRAFRARQSGFCRAFVESIFESIFCVNISKLIKINARVTAIRVTAVTGDPVLGGIGAPLLALLRGPYSYDIDYCRNIYANKLLKI